MISEASFYWHQPDCRFVVSSEIGVKCSCGAVNDPSKRVSKEETGKMLAQVPPDLLGLFS